ncbi:hypothetical protein [Streptomyces sp. NBC_01014]|nr:hypothetical protein OG282_25120 [Streptomyces sp. NBC_01014]
METRPDPRPRTRTTGIWAVKANGTVRFYAGSRTTAGAGAEIIAPASYWKTRITIG